MKVKRTQHYTTDQLTTTAHLKMASNALTIFNISYAGTITVTIIIVIIMIRTITEVWVITAAS